MTSSPTPATVRIDKWLWAARCFKTRTQAQACCDAGHVQVNGEVVRSSRGVRPGDEVIALCPGGKRVLFVTCLAEKRGTTELAASLYEDRTPEEPKPPVWDDPTIRIHRGEGRPSKRDRRKLDRERGW